MKIKYILKTRKGGIIMLEALANLLASLSTAAAIEGSPRTVFFIWDEPECPDELI